MTCIHLQQLYQVCQENQLRLSSSDLIRLVCTQCEKDEVCPSGLVEEYDKTDFEAASGEN
jgi:hypothetical protein